jgi:hypothetical protein
MRILPLVVLVLGLMGCTGNSNPSSGDDHGNEPVKAIHVSDNGRYLVGADGRPFFYLGDTAWELFHKLDREEAVRYLENRTEKGFSVIQAVILAENDGLRVPNPYGEVPLVGLDPETPNEKYFEHVDFIVEKASDLGLVLGLLPTWGDKVTDVNGGAGPLVFDTENAFSFGKYLGSRYREAPVIWILGGDRNVNSEEELAIWISMARGIQEGDGGRNPISYHPRGASLSSTWVHNQDWLAFNMYQSGHSRRYTRVYDYALKGFELQPVKPILDAEPAYEDIAVEFWKYPWSRDQTTRDRVLDGDGLIKDRSFFEQGFFGAPDVRVHAYWNLLSGACGYTYGNNAVWQMYKKGASIAIPCLTDWEEALDRPGADDMRHVRTLFEARDFSRLLPDQSLVYGPNPHGADHVRAALADDASFALLYTPRGKAFQVVLDKVAGEKVIVRWFDPRDGSVKDQGLTENRGVRDFSPPDSGEGRDWVLILDSPDADLPEPGLYGH